MSLLTSIAIVSFILALFILLLLRFSSPYLKNDKTSNGLYLDKKAKTKKTLSFFKKNSDSGKMQIKEGKRGEPHTCPVCAAKFERGETVRSKIFPPTNRNDRLLHISGCPFCLKGERKRECPVCGAELKIEEYLTARIFQRKEKSHVHILGCNHCRLGRNG